MHHEPVCATPSIGARHNHQPPFRRTDGGFQFGLLHCLPEQCVCRPKFSAAWQVSCHFFPILWNSAFNRAFAQLGTAEWRNE